MTGTDWAYVPSARPPHTLLDTLMAATAEQRTDVLDEYGRMLRALDDRQCFAATADNVTRSGAGLAVARALAEDVVPLDRSASYARVMWHLAASLVLAGALGVDAPDRTVDEHARDLAGRAGIDVTENDVERFRRHEALSRAARDETDADVHDAELRTLGAHSARTVVTAGLLDGDALRTALLAAYDAIDRARRHRDAAEIDAVELAASRALVRSLGEELERDEWIRARLRAVKATRPARAIIEARKRLLRHDR